MTGDGGPQGPWTYGGSSWTTNGSDNLGTTSHSRLTSPIFNAVDGGETRLFFVHRYSFGGDLWDGGGVFVSINGGTFTQVPAASFLANGYTGTGLIGNHDLNRGEGFNGDSPGYGDGTLIQTEIRLTEEEAL